MRSIEANYRKIQNRKPNFGTYPCLVQSVKGKNFSRKSLVKAFSNLMPESEYAKDEQKGLIDYLEILTSLSEKSEEEGEIGGKNALGTVK